MTFLMMRHDKCSLQQKCDQYWPPNQGLLAIYGRIQVSMVCLDAQDAFTLRVLRLKLLRVENEKLVDDEDCPERDVLHFHYTAWPDHGTPETAGQLLAFIQKSSQSNRDTDGPIVVHCRWVFLIEKKKSSPDGLWKQWCIKCIFRSSLNPLYARNVTDTLLYYLSCSLLL